MLRRWLGVLVLAIFRWKSEGGLPDVPRCVLIAAPHTSNWDLVMTVAIGFALGVKFRWLGKAALFRGGFGWLMRALGGVPVIRGERSDQVRAIAEMLNREPEMILAVPAEGTRSRTEYWKSGFLHIARTAKVPIVLGYLDFGRRRGGFGPPVDANRPVREVMDEVRAFYADKTGKHPENFGPIRLREEDDEPPPS